MPTHYAVFVSAVVGSFRKRSAALASLIAALLSTPRPSSVVEISLAPSFERKFASVYDALTDGQIDEASLRQILREFMPTDVLRIGGYRVVVVDCTPIPRPNSPTLAERGWQRVDDRAVPGIKLSAVVSPMSDQGGSWVVPIDIRRVRVEMTANQVAVEQVREVVAASKDEKIVFVVDGGYEGKAFLAEFVGKGPRIAVAVRLRGNRVLYEPTPPKSGRRGRPRVHGDRFPLHSPGKPDRVETMVSDKGANLVLSAWLDKRLMQPSDLPGVVVRVEAVDDDGKPRFKRPIWLFWTGDPSTRLHDIANAYFARFAVEHFFRFAKGSLGLEAPKTIDVKALDNWHWIVLLAYWSLLLNRDKLRSCRPWDPKLRRESPIPTPGQSLMAWPAIYPTFGEQPPPPKPRGKSPGRRIGFTPTHKPHTPVAKSPRSCGNKPENTPTIAA